MKWPLVLVAIGCAACTRQEAPQPDPAAVDRLLVRLDAQQSGVAEELGPKASQKLNRAERLVAPLEKVQPDKINPEIALSLIAG